MLHPSTSFRQPLLVAKQSDDEREFHHSYSEGISITLMMMMIYLPFHRTHDEDYEALVIVMMMMVPSS